MLTFTFKPEPADVAEVMKAMSEMRFSLRLTGGLLLMTPFLLTALPLLKGVPLQNALALTWPTLVACWGFFLIGRPIAYRMMASHALRIAPVQAEERTVTLADDAIHIETGGRSGTIAWQDVGCVVETRRALVIVLGGTKGLGLPRRIFQNPGQLEDTRALLREKLGARAKV